MNSISASHLEVRPLFSSLSYLSPPVCHLPSLSVRCCVPRVPVLCISDGWPFLAWRLLSLLAVWAAPRVCVFSICPLTGKMSNIFVVVVVFSYEYFVIILLFFRIGNIFFIFSIYLIICTYIYVCQWTHITFNHSASVCFITVCPSFYAHHKKYFYVFLFFFYLVYMYQCARCTDWRAKTIYTLRIFSFLKKIKINILISNTPS